MIVTKNFTGIWDQPDQESQGFVIQVAAARPSVPITSTPKVDFRDSAKIKSALDAQLREWESTRYRLGGLFTQHVGIYVEDQKFVHASTSKGVTLSSLDNSYWSKKYWKSVRMANLGQ